MASFDVSNYQGVQAPAIQVQAPISGSDDVNTAAALNSIFSTGVKMYQGVQQEKAAKAANSYVANFQNELLKVADSVDQGVRSSQAARTYIRKLYGEAITSNPSMADELQKAMSGTLSGSGLGKVIESGTEEEKMVNKLRDEAYQNHYLDLGASPEAQERQLEAYRKSKMASEELKRLSERRAALQAQVNLDKSELDLQETLLKRQARDEYRKIASADTVRIQKDLSLVVQQVQSGAMSPEEGVQHANNIWFQVQQQAAAIGAEAGTDFVTGLTTPMKMLYENTKDVITGKISADVLSQRNELAMAQANQTWLSNPKIAASVSLARLTPNAGLLTMRELNEEAAAMLAKIGAQPNDPTANLNPLSKDPSDIEAFKVSTKVLKDNVKALNRGTARDAEGTAQVVNNGLVNILKDLDVYSAKSEDVAGLNRIIEMVADPEFGTFLEKGQGIPAQVAGTVSQITTQQYENVVLPLLRREYEDAIVVSADPARQMATVGAYQSTPVITRANITEVGPNVKPVWRGNSMMFVQTGEPNVALAGKVKKLNDRVAKTINNMVRFGAHLEGHKNYKKIYEERYAEVFGVENPEAKARVERVAGFPAVPGEGTVLAPNTGATANATGVPGTTSEGGATQDPEGVVEAIYASLPAVEGSGDTVTDVATENLGVTASARAAINAPEDMPAEEVAKKYLQHLHTNWSKMDKYTKAPTGLKRGLLDTSYNWAGVMSPKEAPKLHKALENENWTKAALELLDTAKVLGKGDTEKTLSKGLAVRRAKAYNEVVTDDPIKTVEVTEDGTVEYKDGDGRTIFKYTVKGGLNKDSKPGTVEL